MNVTMMPSDPGTDATRRRDLRRMRTVAVGLLFAAAGIYLATLDAQGWWEFVHKGSEAAMIGAIADWFAVTALFKRPMGLPIPHTALVPRRKDDLAQGLEAFVGENFLQEQVIRDRIDGIEISRRVADWLSRPENAERVVDEASDLLRIGLGKVREEHIESLVRDALVPRFREEQIAPLLGGLLSEVLVDNLQHGVVDLVLDELYGWLIANPDTVQQVLEERAPWWAPQSVNDIVTSRLHREMVRWVAEIRAEPQHRARRALDSMLHQLAADLLENPETQERAERLKERVLDHPAVLNTAVAIWNALRRAFVGSLADPDGVVRQRALVEVQAGVTRLQRDAALRAKLDGMAADAVVFAVERYGPEITAVISHTISGWDGKEAARKIELHVGRDLQFIRINGTVVGALVGMVIHALTLLIT